MDVLKDLIELVHHQTQDLDVDNNLEDEFKALKHRKYSLRLIQLLINNVLCQLIIFYVNYRDD